MKLCLQKLLFVLFPKVYIVRVHIGTLLAELEKKYNRILSIAAAKLCFVFVFETNKEIKFIQQSGTPKTDKVTWSMKQTPKLHDITKGS